MRLPANPIRITGPGGAAWTVGKATISGATVTVPVTATGPGGAYTLAWRVISDDGDAVSGTIRFALATPKPAPAPAPTVTTAAAATTVPVTTAVPAPETALPISLDTSTPEPAGGVPGWLWVIGGVAVAAVVAGLVVVRARR